MKNIPNVDDYTKAFYSDGYKLAMLVSENQNSKKILFDAIQQMYENINDLIESLGNFCKTTGTNHRL